jgi:hypothetical protein
MLSITLKNIQNEISKLRKQIKPTYDIEKYLAEVSINFREKTMIVEIHGRIVEFPQAE